MDKEPKDTAPELGAILDAIEALEENLEQATVRVEAIIEKLKKEPNE